MKRIVTLTREQRSAILNQLTTKQVQAIGEFTRYMMLSQFHTRHYLDQTDWQFVGIVVDPYYHRDQSHQGENLYCDCGRRLKNQFILRSRMTGKQLFLGISHFQQHTSIPQKVIREIKAGLNQINIYRDQILLAYQRGQRFPQKLYQEVLAQGGFKNREGTLLFQRCQLFNQVDLPLHPRDFQELRALKTPAMKRLTKQEIQQVLDSLTLDWRQIDQQITLFNYQLRQVGLSSQDLHRIKSNSINYALQRRKSRFLVHNYKQISSLTLSKARAQLAIKLRQLSFYVQLLTDYPQVRVKRVQAVQTLQVHDVKVGHSHYFGLKEAKDVLVKNDFKPSVTHL